MQIACKERYFFLLKAPLLFILLLIVLLTAGCTTGEIYLGDTESGLPHGSGTLTYTGGAKYSGTFFLGLRDGFGRWIHPSGITYEGEWKDDRYHGRGELCIPGSFTYDGSWLEGRKDGYGIQTWPDNRRYEGFWKNGHRHGYGIMYYEDGSSFEGQWSEGRKVGRGMLVTAEGDTLIGQWLNGKFQYVPVEKIILDTDTINLVAGQEGYGLIFEIYPPDATDQKVALSSSEPEVAAVNNAGLVTPLAAGESIISVTAVAEKITESCLVTVEPPYIPVQSINLNHASLSLYTDDEPVTLIAAITPSGATNKTVYWSSDNPEIASVSSSGRVTPLTEGRAIITVQTEAGGYIATCAVTVFPNLPQPEPEPQPEPDNND